MSGERDWETLESKVRVRTAKRKKKKLKMQVVGMFVLTVKVRSMWAGELEVGKKKKAFILFSSPRSL